MRVRAHRNTWWDVKFIIISAVNFSGDAAYWRQIFATGRRRRRDVRRRSIGHAPRSAGGAPFLIARRFPAHIYLGP
ncbi:hypothetical protein EVAR_9654_1 [Eumeta japonica]|uniref:Uncharacterized protein n=1 Tax=Eumeta variegata TaxID=151549 RepID=A0A4C1TJU4_EUMVA|nr:hypothetical protein EVAR_9654_1 [Eumeta japonica]